MRRSLSSLMSCARAAGAMRAPVAARAARLPSVVGARVPVATARAMSTMYDDPDFPMNNGRCIHLDITRGEIANRVLCCGEGSRARAIADKYLDKDGPRFELVSHREFVIITGTFNKVPVSVIGTLMGFPNTDFVVRECRAVTSGTMAFIRFGSCGGMNETKAGTVAVADKTIGIYRNPGAWYGEDVEPYFTTPPIPGDAELTELLRERMKAHVTDSEVVGGINASADMFYGSQGRPPKFFDDRNEGLLERIEAKHPDLAVCEMETNHLFDLAHMSHEPMRASGAAMVYANRRYKNVTSPEQAAKLVEQGGLACLEALTMLPLAPEELMDGPECVWNKE